MTNENEKDINANENSTARFIPEEDAALETEGEFEGFSSRSDLVLDKFQRKFGRFVEMLYSSFTHLKSPIAIASIIILIGVYILLGVAGDTGFKFYDREMEQKIVTNLDIIVNAALGFFFGPVTSAIGVTLCTIVRIITNGSSSSFSIAVVFAAACAGFLHGWILYHLRSEWFGRKIRSFYIWLLARVIFTRFMVSTFINILLIGLFHKVINGYPFLVFLTFYSKSGVPLTSISSFVKVFFVALAFESLIVFLALLILNFVTTKIFTKSLPRS